MKSAYEERALDIAFAAARAHGLLRTADIADYHKPAAKNIVNEIAALLWPDDETMKWSEKQ